MYMVHNFIRLNSGFITLSFNNFTKLEVLLIPTMNENEDTKPQVILC